MTPDLSALQHELTILKNNFKQYIIGGTYNGIAVTLSDANFTLFDGYLRPYRTIETSNGNDAEYMLWGQFGGRYNPGTTLTALLLTGVSFHGGASSGGAALSPSIVAYDVSAIPSAQVSFARAGEGAVNNIQISFTGAAQYIICQFDLRINSWPTWADAII